METTTTMQYKSGSRWIDINDQEMVNSTIANLLKFELGMAEYKNRTPAFTDTVGVIAALESGAVLAEGENWDARIRFKPAPHPEPVIDPRPILRCKSCGQSGHSGAYPFSTAAHTGKCDDCI